VKAREIAPADWARFFAQFTRLHSGAIITMGVSGDLTGTRDAVVGQPLRGISEDGADVLIHVGIGTHRSTDHLGHRIAHVRRIRLRQTSEGADAALDLEAADGTKTTLRFRSPMLPELLESAVE